ncbi:T9SS type A sorting domain-containing protein [Cryomorpha ignava]|uniref:T9SS type A sorting domain-containing protein n=1 Tax=Cryomorpha ignava TaxID=101383 RepID=A0A7K3WMH1_9FLAO|nr:endonuclease [Cryomorpha ignava]NEN22674.1 T9SS type A sorting domain-containing protein [Cryomorpha ignava]
MKKIYFFIGLMLFCGLVASAQSVELDSDQISFGTITYGDMDSVIVQITNLTNEEVDVYEPQFFDVYNSSPFYVNIYPATLAANETASFFLVFKPIHNIVHNSEMVISTSGNRGAVSLDLLGDCVYPGTYYGATHNLLDENLETAFHEFLDDNYQDFGYSGARDKMFMEYDNQRVNGQGSAENRITRVYLGTDAVGYTSRQNAQSSFNLNTEHTFPQGNFNSASPMVSDMHHLYVTDVDANATRGSYAFGNAVNNITWQMGGSKLGTDENGITVFEPRDAQKGKSARAILYFLLRYQNYGGFLTATQEQDLREWCALFPPDEVDVNRNNDIFALQNNRNPFVDYPQFIDRIYNLRLVENRPNVGYIALSTEAVYFGDVAATGDEVYNVVMTNYGERFITITNLELADNSTASFDFVDGAPGNLVINPGESVSLPVSCSATSNSEDLEAMLNFTSNAVNGASYSIPVTADFATGLAHADAYAEIVVYPNPFSSNITLSNLDQPVSQIKMFDISGRICFIQDGNLNSFSVNQLNAGIYQMVVTMLNGDMFTRKVVKQ